MFVVDIPERQIVQDTCGIRNLKEDRRLLVANCTPHHADKLAGSVDMFQSHFAANEIGAVMRVLGTVEVIHKFDGHSGRYLASIRYIARIKADTVIAA